MKLLHKMMISCIKSTELMEKKIFVGLTFYEKINLFFHKKICDACVTYQKQTEIMEKLLHRHIHSGNEEQVTQIKNQDLKERIIAKL